MNSQQVTLRKPQWDDMPFIRRMWGDPATMRPVGGPIQLDDRQARRWYEHMVDPGRDSECYRLILNEQETPVGEISFHRLDLQTMTANINIKIISSQRGRGYATEAMRRFLEYFFNDRGGRILVDDVAEENVAGQQALLNFGFEHDATVQGVFRLHLTRERFHSVYGRREGG